MKAVMYILTIPLVIGIFQSCTQPFTQGKALYEVNCSRCHGMDGRGFEDLYPGFLQSPYIHGSRVNLACVITYGSTYLNSGKEEDSEVLMPDNQHLTAVEVLNIVNYLSWEFGNKKQTKIETVMQALQDCER